MDDTNEVPAEDIITMADEIRRGVRPADSTVAMTPSHRQVWDDLADQVRGRSRRAGPKHPW